MNINFNEMPSGYALCIINSCPMSAHCLRQLAMQSKVKKDKIITIVNPHLTKPSESCEFYRSDQIATFAKGFSKMKEQMLPGQYNSFMSQLKDRFGRTGYFEHRRGERLCTPDDIAFIQEVLDHLGLPHLPFDDYVEQINWQY